MEISALRPVCLTDFPLSEMPVLLANDGYRKPEPDQDPAARHQPPETHPVPGFVTANPLRKAVQPR